ncbi:hypothetical protein HMPREF0731_1341, partial [Pseudoroseomonas cervicalis ATCC 49957]
AALARRRLSRRGSAAGEPGGVTDSRPAAAGPAGRPGARPGTAKRAGPTPPRRET